MRFVARKRHNARLRAICMLNSRFRLLNHLLKSQSRLVNVDFASWGKSVDALWQQVHDSGCIPRRWNEAKVVLLPKRDGGFRPLSEYTARCLRPLSRVGPAPVFLGECQIVPFLMHMFA